MLFILGLFIASLLSLSFAKNDHQKIYLTLDIDEINDVIKLEPSSLIKHNIFETLNTRSEIIFSNANSQYRFVNLNKLENFMSLVSSQSALLKMFILEPELFINSKKFSEVEVILEEILRESVEQLEERNVDNKETNEAEVIELDEIVTSRAQREVTLENSRTLLVYPSGIMMSEPSKKYHTQNPHRFELPTEELNSATVVLERSVSISNVANSGIFDCIGTTTFNFIQSPRCADSDCISVTYYPTKKTVLPKPTVVIVPSNITAMETHTQTLDKFPINTILFEREDGSSRAYMLTIGWNHLLVILCALIISMITFIV
ncbi:hypothetical protein RNJ44_03676 [Nakaseomyces bracarensis]|uniref:Uncharacterized protein n=1 Tax=Nakaseomyces bracarensis TaxID=273131 RepID=A0ABR4NXM1_9SACH